MRQPCVVESKSRGPNQLQSESALLAVWLRSLFSGHVIFLCKGRVRYLTLNLLFRKSLAYMFKMVPWWARGWLSCFLEDFAFTLKLGVTLLHFTRRMRSFSFPYPLLQKVEESSWDNKPVGSDFHELPSAGRVSLGCCSPLLGSGRLGSTGWWAGCIPVEENSGLLLLSPPRPFASIICFLCGVIGGGVSWSGSISQTGLAQRVNAG